MALNPIAAVVRCLKERRIAAILPRVEGRLLDIGCGNNELVRRYGSGVGVDVHPWDGVDLVVADSAHLPFEPGSFDTITFVASLNHIPNRDEVLKEARRLLAPGGAVIATMITPTISAIWHQITRASDEDQTDRGMAEGEVWGFTVKQMFELFGSCGFEIVDHKRFVFGLNHLYIARTRLTQCEAVNLR